MSKIRRVFDRMRAGEDLGLDRTGQVGRQRSLNADGTYNMQRITGRLFGDFTLYHWLITTSWRKYWLVVFSFYAGMNLLFAAAYFFMGPEQLGGMPNQDAGTQFLYCFFFSTQSFTTVGYGGIHPQGIAANSVAGLEAFMGLMTFAIATGTLYGRFSKPVSRIRYSKNILIAPFRDITGLQFMVANELRTTLMEMEAKVSIGWFENDGSGKLVRKFQQVKLELDKISMFPTSWVINHPIDEESALFGRSIDEITNMDFEVFVLLKGFDDVFSQTIYSRYSYQAKDLIHGAKFRKPFYVNDDGRVVMNLTKVGEYDVAEVPVIEWSNS